ncbi:MAG: hypothetical protein WAU68_12295 [Vitreimonas sp.]
MVDAGAITAVLNQIRDELSPQYPHHASLAAKLAGVVEHDWAHAATHYCSGDWWGGSGSVFDISPEDAGQRRRLATLLVDLVERFDREGIYCAAADASANILRGWLSAGVI